MKQKILGIIGGLGTETSCTLCVNVNKRLRAMRGVQPHLLMENVPMPLNAEHNLIRGTPSEGTLELLQSSVQRFNQLQVDAIVIPCNSVHVFLERLRAISASPILSIIEETAKVCKTHNLKRVGLLATSTTINQRLHANELKKHNIELIVPDLNDQDNVNESIARILRNTATRDDKTKLLEIIKKFSDFGAQGIILGCTDLPLVIKDTDVPDLRMIDTLTVLEDAMVSLLGEK